MTWITSVWRAPQARPAALLMSVFLVGPVMAVLPASPAASAAPAAASKEGQLRVQLFAQQQTVLSAELSARIARLNLREGDNFTAGQTLVAFDCAIFQSQLNKAEAQLEAARQTLRVNKRLAELNSISNLEVEQADAKVKETRAEVASVRVVVGKCTLNAPFSGRVAKVHVDPFQYVTPGKPILDIVNTRNLEVRLIVPSRWLAWVRKGHKITVHLDELNRDYSARVTRMGARIDPVSQSVSMAAEIDGKPSELLPGMSGWAVFPIPK